MSRYIDADALWDKMQKFYTDGDCGDDDGYNLGINVGITKCHNLLTKVPSIEIIRCRECKAYDSECEWCGGLGLGMKPDDFCSYGSRSEKPNNSEVTTDCRQTERSE